MDHQHHHTEQTLNDTQTHHEPSLNRTALSATVHCLTGCAIGEVLGMIIGTGLGGWNTISYSHL